MNAVADPELQRTPGNGTVLNLAESTIPANM